MKIAITGKGGAGKTSLSYLLGLQFLARGNHVLLVDADPDGNLPDLMGFSPDAITPLIDMKELIRERTGSDPEAMSAYFKLNPKVDDIPEQFALTRNGLKVLIMGTVRAGGGCACPQNSFVRQLLRHLVIEREEVVILDMEAGVEHLGRRTADHVDCLIIISEPNKTGLTTARRIIQSAQELKIPRFILVGNKIMSPQDKQYISTAFPAVDPIFLPFSQQMYQLSRQSDLALHLEPEVEATLKALIERLNQEQTASL